MVTSVTGSSKVSVPKKHSTEMVEIDFAPPFRRISIMQELEKHVGTLPSLEDPGSHLFSCLLLIFRLCRTIKRVVS